MRIAVIADIHGNLPALDAVLADIDRRQIERIVNLGDVASGPLWPRETMLRLAERPMPTVRGNHDRWVGGDDPARMGKSDRFAHGDLTAAQRGALAALPAMLDIGDGIVAFHATPADDTRYLVETVRDGQLVRDGVAAIAARLGGVPARVALCGHSHLPHLVQIPGGALIVNPGSVGCPAYDDDAAPAHVSESGAPHARYAVLTLDAEAVSAEFVALDYAWGDAAARAERNVRPEWAHALRTGLMPRG